MTPTNPASALVALMRRPETRSPAVVNEYYTRCIPHYRELLGDHWHTGFYLDDDQPIGVQDQLRMEQLIARSAGIDRKTRVLDVGCGMGGPSCHLARFTGARFHGVTPNTTQLQMAQRLARRVGVDTRVTFTQASAMALPVADESVDVVLFFESPCHFPDRGMFFREACRVLRRGGRLAGEDWLAAADAATATSTATAREHVDAIGRTWAIPRLGTLDDYATGMASAGMHVEEAIDMKTEMSLLRGFLVNEDDRAAVAEEMRATDDPIRRVILEGLLCLGDAAGAGAFTIGRFLASKP